MAKKKAPGKYVKCGGYEVFVPESLPPEIVWSGSLIRSLSDADGLWAIIGGRKEAAESASAYKAFCETRGGTVEQD